MSSRKSISVIFYSLFSFIMLFLMSCSSGGGSSSSAPSASLIGITVTPSAPSIAKGIYEQFTATGTYSDNTTQNITGLVTWNSSDTSKATVDNFGRALAVDAGNTTITATKGSISGTGTMTVTNATLVSMTVTPASPSIAKGTAQQFSVIGIFSDNTLLDLTTQVTWNSLDTLKATVDNKGLASGAGVGSATITASLGTVSATASLTVTNATLVSLSVTPTNASVAPSATQQLAANGSFSDGTSQDVTTQVSWNTSDSSKATINSSGVVTGVASGSATLTASFGNVSSSVTVTITNPSLGTVQLSGTVQADPSDSSASGKQSGATVYVVGQQSSGVKTDSNGNFTLNVNPQLSGTVLASPKVARSAHRASAVMHDVTQTLSYGIVVVDNDDTHGVKSNVLVVTNQTNTCPTLYINTVGSISGHAYLQGQTDNSGITVYIPGTSFSAITAADGSYTISGVPSGTYDYLRAEKFGTTYHYAILSNVTVVSTQDTPVADMVLQLSAGAFGAVMINNGAVFTNNKDVTLSIATSSDAVLMSVSSDPTFVGSTWVPVQATYPFSFPSPYPTGGQTVNMYVKFAQESGLASEPTTTSIYLDTNPQATMVGPGSVTMSTTPTLHWDYTAPMPNPEYHVQVATDSGFSNILPGEDQTNLPQKQYTISTTLNNMTTYYWRVAIIYNGTQLNWGPAWSFQVNRNAGTLQSPANFSLTNNQAPQFTWLANSSASSYAFALSTNADLSAPIRTQSGIIGSAYTPLSLPTTTSMTYYWAVTPYDSLGNPGVQSSIWQFTLDTVAPTGNITIGNTIFTAMRDVTLSLSATDANGVSSYFASDTTMPSGVNDSGWQPMTPSSTLTLSSSSGVHTVNVWFKDTVGNYATSQTSNTIGLINFTDNIQTLDTGGIRFPSIAVCAPYGHAFIVYMDTLNAWVKYTTNAGGSWAPPIYVDQNSVSLPGTNHSIACNSEYQGIHAALRDSSGGTSNLVYAFRGYYNGWPLDWLATVKDTAGGINWTPSITVDTSNNAYISYDENGSLYFTSNLTSWAKQAVDTTGSMFNSSIVLDSTGRAHITYHDHANWTLKYAYADSPYNTWTVSTIDSAPTTSLGMSGSLAIDSNNNLHVAYMDYTNHALKYATKPNGSSAWSIYTIDTTLSQYDIDYSFQNVSIAVAGPNQVFISYGTSNGLKLATNYFAGTWATSFVDTSWGVGDTSIAIDSGTKTIHIVYEVGDSLLKYTKGQYW